jgi:hypothetical protein
MEEKRTKAIGARWQTAFLPPHPIHSAVVLSEPLTLPFGNAQEKIALPTFLCFSFKSFVRTDQFWSQLLDRRPLKIESFSDAHQL